MESCRRTKREILRFVDCFSLQQKINMNPLIISYCERKRKGGNFFMEKTKSMFRTSAKELKTTSTLAVCAMLVAFIYGCFYYKYKLTFRRVLIAKLVVILAVNILLNTLWLDMLY